MRLDSFNIEVQDGSETPIVVPTYLRFRLNPGDYVLFMQTMRVSGPRGNKSETGFRTTSNVLRITVLPNK